MSECSLCGREYSWRWPEHISENEPPNDKLKYCSKQCEIIAQKKKRRTVAEGIPAIRILDISQKKHIAY